MRIRDLGYCPGSLPTGTKNSILDVKDVFVGQTTLHEGDGIHTGITVILPRHPKDLVKHSYAGLHSLNGMGEVTGAHVIHELGLINAPIALTSTVSVGKVYDALFLWQIEQARARGEDEFEMVRSIGIPVVAETLDVILNDISLSAVEKHHVYAALDKAVLAPEVLEGSYGGGTGMRCHGYKGGTGTSSRVVKGREKDFMVGVICQANYGHVQDLKVGSVPVGKFLEKESSKEKSARGEAEATGKANEGSCIVIIATDAPFLPHQLRRLAQHATAGLTAVSGYGVGRNSSGEIFFAFSTANAPDDKLTISGESGYNPIAERFQVESIKNESIDTFFYAVAEATEEAILNAMVGAKDGLTGWKGRRADGLPIKRIQELLNKYQIMSSIS